MDIKTNLLEEYINFVKYVQYFNELNFQKFDFTNGFKCSVVHRFIELN